MARRGDILAGRVYISIVIPTLDEAGNIKRVISGIKDVMKGYSYEIIVVDSNSADGTASIAKRMGVKVISTGAGKGAALIRGFKEARGKILIAMDADLSHRPEELKLLIAGIETGYDMCSGSRYITGGGSEDITLVRRFGNKVFVLLVNLLYSSHFTDLAYGYKAFTKDAIRRLRLSETGYGIETEMHVRAARVGLKVIEVPSFEKKRVWGSGKLTSLRDGRAILRVIFRNVDLSR